MPELQRFMTTYRPGPDVRQASAELLSRYAQLVPASLLHLWQTVGFGAYDGGLLQIVNPDDYRRLLHGWLMLDEDDPTRLPIGVSGFGRLFYYRRLTDEGDEDVCMIDPHSSTATAEVLTWSLDDFFEQYLCDDAARNDVLQVADFSAATAQHGPLGEGQMFAYSPALRLGGDGSIARLSKADARVHLDFLLQLALAS